MGKRWRGDAWRLGVLPLAVLLTGLWASCQGEVTPELGSGSAALAASGPQVRGYLAVTTGNAEQGGKGEDLYVPEARVTLRNASTGEQSDASLTDLSGRFTVRVKDPGRYRLCWDIDGVEPGCANTFVSIGGKLKNIGTVRVSLPAGRGRVALYGRVTLADGASARAIDPQANVNAFARVTLLDKEGNALAQVPVTNFDTYLFPSVRAGELLGLRVEEEGYKREQPLRLASAARPFQKIDLTIDNYAPEHEPLVALDSSGRRVSNAAAGARVTLNARVSDRDGDSLRHLWRVSSGSLSSATDLAPQWILPRTPGNHAATLVTYDGRGGYATSSVNITIDRAGITFSGVVSGTDAPVLSGAQVDVNGAVAVTDQNGFFRLKVTDRKRFVMTIRKSGYAFASHIYYDKVVGGSWTLTKAQIFRVDPTLPIDIQNKRRPSECRGAPSTRLDWANHPKLAAPQWQDGHGNVIPAPRDAEKQPGLPDPHQREQPRRECGPGIRVQIPANGIVDANGNAPSGLVDIQLATVDLATGDQMPGDYTVDGGGSVGKMAVSYGAGSVEISANGTRYNLRAGVKAKLTMPVDAVQLAAGGALPATIPLLRYDEPRGVWLEEGSLGLQNVGGSFAYVTDVPHFTAYNSDLIKTGQACLAIQNIGMPASYRLEVTVPQSGGAAPASVVRTVNGGNQEIALLNLPVNTNITLVPVRTTDPDPNKNNLPMGVFVVNTGAPQNPAWPTVPGGFTNEPMGPPYYHETGGVSDGACSTKVEVRDLGLAFYPQTPTGGAFLHGMSGFAAVNLSETDPAFPGDANTTLRDAVAQASADYRAQIDPRGLRPTLSCFKVVNRLPLRPGESCPEHTGTGFAPQAPLAETSAVYANTVDLGFGRDMHCVQNGANVACYVSNYDSLVYTGPGSASDATKAQSAADGHNGLIAPDATVAMEYSPVEDTAPNGSPVTDDGVGTVKFYVFDQTGHPLDAANLDGLGARPVPQLCMVCHGGYLPNAGPPSTGTGVPTPIFESRDDVRLDARFLPFDLRSFTFAAPDSAVANPFTKANQQVAFRTLNEMAKLAPPPDPFDPFSDAMNELYDAWYPGGAVPQLENATVDAWNTDALHASTYSKVVAKTCRTCHIANIDGTLRFERPGSSAGVGFDGRLGAIQLRVCKEHVMPHARRTHDLFWTSVADSQPALLQAYGDTINAFGWQRVGDPGVDPSLVCGTEYTQGGGVISPVTPYTPVKTVLSSCVGCHNEANAASADYAYLNLESDVSYGQLVGTPSVELPAMLRVSAGSDTNSFLWRKLENSHTGLGSYQYPGPGVAMPQGSSGLNNTDPTAAAKVRTWILDGALP